MSCIKLQTTFYVFDDQTRRDTSVCCSRWKAIKYSLRQLQLVSVFINCLFLVHSQFIYELTRHEGTSPIAAVVQTWIQKISEKLNIMIRYSERLYGVLVNRANYIRRKVKQCAGSVPKKRFLQLGWEFKLERSEVEVNAISQDIEQFKAQITTLESQKKSLNQRIRSHNKRQPCYQKGYERPLRLQVAIPGAKVWNPLLNIRSRISGVWREPEPRLVKCLCHG